MLVTLRYAMNEPGGMDGDYLLGWTQVDAVPERIDSGLSRADTTDWVDAWLDSRRSLLAAIQSTVLPEADVIFLNPRHRDAGAVPALTVRQFRFSECLHRPPAFGQFVEGRS